MNLFQDYMTKMEELAARNDELAADRNKWEKEVESLKEQTNNNSGLQSRVSWNLKHVIELYIF